MTKAPQRSSIPDGWPAIGVAEAYLRLTAPGMPFEMEERTVLGRPVRVYKRCLGNLRMLLNASLAWKDREFLVYEDDRLTYDAHYRAVAALARIFVERYEIGKGDRIAIAMRNFPEWSIAFFAATAIGAVAVPLNAWGLADDLCFGIENAGCKIAIVDGERLERLQARPPAGASLIAVRTAADQLHGAVALGDLIGDFGSFAGLPSTPPPEVHIDPDDDATIFYTSGTTGVPKGALGTHRNILTNILNVDFCAAFAALRRGAALPADDPQGPQKVNLLPAPFFHVTGCHSTLVIAISKGRKVVLMHKWNAEKALQLIAKEKVTNTTGVPSMAWQLIGSPDFAASDVSSIEGISYGGAAAAPELTRRVAELFPGVLPRQGYGATETSSVTSSNCAEDFQNRPESVGPAVPVCDVRIVRDDGTTAPTGEVGEIWIFGPNVVKGYWNNPQATAAAFPGGWYRTGDIGRLDEDGFIYVLDRIKDMLIRGGENIYCVEIEAILAQHEAVLEAAVIGLPHKVLGEEVAAVVQVRPGSSLTGEALRAFAANRLAAHKVPKVVALRTDEMPRNATGKILKRVLRDALLDGMERNTPD